MSENTHIHKSDYYDPFFTPVTGDVKVHNALERAWKNRDFEIDKYWSRATYFWAFIASTFAAYLSIASSENLDDTTKLFLSFIIIIVGLFLSLAWNLVTIGSKKWQENWEKHIDLLEDAYTGPLYKTVLNQKTYSVSGINQMVSKFIISIWMFLLLFHINQNLNSNVLSLSERVLLGAFVAVASFFCIVMLKKRKDYEILSPAGKYSFRRRFIDYEDPTEVQEQT
ncbi:hypothetical protein GJU39_21975 [Pedobacter petrophilus]|uniref:Uncharacterized protein n=1 Tax=Pedobacter petrophilus TaxID=1908241 RepID=A0A7K0G6B8_9SPHI|nr:hypothetical protein [Pedobacter petrophilus]MRX78749.1 hypothetical protein [Pedobacter petrophilus]